MSKRRDKGSAKVSRREFLGASGKAALAAGVIGGVGTACSDGSSTGADGGGGGRDGSGGTKDLSILQWVHFVPEHDRWFEPFATNWGDEHNLNVNIQRVSIAEIRAKGMEAINNQDSQTPPDLIQFIAPPSDVELLVQDLTDVQEEAIATFGPQLDHTTRSTFNPKTNKFYGYCHGWTPNPGNYRKSWWDLVMKEELSSEALAEGPQTWQQVLSFGEKVLAQSKSDPSSLGLSKPLDMGVGIGLAPELDANMETRALLYSHGAFVQNAESQITINSPETVAAVAFMKEMFEKTMDPAACKLPAPREGDNCVFDWSAVTNNNFLLDQRAAFILNSVSVYRTGQKAEKDNIADDIFFVPPPKGPGGSRLISQHVAYIYVIPNKAKNPNAAKDFLLHLTRNYNQAVFSSQMYNLPAFLDTVPQLQEEDSWFDVDPFGSTPKDKLKLLKTASEWSTSVGHPGPANPAIGEVFSNGTLPLMMQKAASGEMTPEEAVKWAEDQIKPVYEKWRTAGLL